MQTKFFYTNFFEVKVNMQVHEAIFRTLDRGRSLDVMQEAEQWEINIVRDMAKRYLEICYSESNMTKRELWKNFNALGNTRPLVNLQYFHAIKEILPIIPYPKTIHLASVETAFLLQFWHYDNIDDDQIFDPWIQVAARRYTVPGTWGIEQARLESSARSWRILPAITKIEQLDRLIATPHRILDEDPQLAKLLRSFFGDLLPIHVNKGTVYGWWNGVDLSETMNRLLGMEEFMILMYDDPDLIHALMKKLRDGILANLAQVDNAGDWSSCDGYNHAMLPTHGLPDAVPNTYGADPKTLWWFMHGQEFEVCSPDQHNEFLLKYQLPIMEKFGLISYGCCESLDIKIDILRQIPNLRRICVGPHANLAKIAEQVGNDIILSWRPISTIINANYSIESVHNLIKDGLAAADNKHVEIILKDIMTFNGHPERMFEFARICKEEISNYY